jgi:multidrug transporter EmrE-like cation transporter
MNIIILLLSVIALSVLYTVFAKQYTLTKKKRCIVYVLLIELITLLVYIVLLQKYHLSYIYPIITILSIIAMTFIGIVLYKKCITKNIIFGLIFAIIAIVLLSI